MTPTSPVIVVYVGGTGRSGSTILANLLGEVSGYVSVGEVRFLWQRGMIEDRLCGCGVRFADCPFWSEVLERAFGSHVPDPVAVHSMLRSRTRMRSVPRMMRGRRRVIRQGFGFEGPALEADLTALYEAIAVVSGSRVIVDSSKLPTYAALIDALPGLDVRLLHLVRDPRASAYSWLRRKELTDQRAPTYMEQRGVTKSAVLWTVWNLVLERMWRGSPEAYRRLTYEGFLEDPESTLQSVVQWIGGGGDPLSCFTGEGSVVIGVHHTVAGNPGRMTQGDVKLTVDDEWTRALDSRSRRLIAVVTRPLLRRYGYASREVVGTASID